ncbi:MAG TPA: restriction endonuclease subunit S [Pseudomonadales bacterium]|nr:restriction endonuclease subunit S [Pseudomonadales bacterium]
MAVNWPRVPALDSPDALDGPLPESWRLDKIENLYELLPIGKRFDQKSSSPQGRVPVIDQSEAGVIGWHNEEPGVKASESRPVVTFANHTCEMRWMQQSFSVIQNVFPLIGRSGVCDTRFLYYGTKGRVHLEEYKGHFPDYRRKWIPVPPIPEQRAIAHILGTLDDKIELNRRMSETLEAMARALFKSWFVDFDPVRAKMEGRDPGLPQALADLFPARLVDSELGEIPEGWDVASLPEVADVNPTRALRKGVSAPYLDMANMPTNGHSADEVIDRKFGSGMRFINGDTLVARITPCLENGKTAFVDFLEDGQVGWGSTEYIVLHPKAPLPEEYAYCLARSAEFREFAIQSMTGTSGRQRVPAESLTHFRVAVPPRPIAEAFGRAVKPRFARASAAVRESRTLAALRDALLPKLISGELRAQDPKRFVVQGA